MRVPSALQEGPKSVAFGKYQVNREEICAELGTRVLILLNLDLHPFAEQFLHLA